MVWTPRGEARRIISVNYPVLKDGACKAVRRLGCPGRTAVTCRRLQPVVKTHSGMLPQSRTLEEWDPARQR